MIPAAVPALLLSPITTCGVLSSCNSSVAADAEDLKDEEALGPYFSSYRESPPRVVFLERYMARQHPSRIGFAFSYMQDLKMQLLM